MSKLVKKLNSNEKNIPLDNNFISKNSMNLNYNQQNSIVNNQNNLSRIELINKKKFYLHHFNQKILTKKNIVQ